MTRLADALADRHPRAVISSPLQQAVATAQAIGSTAGAPVTIDARLIDRDYPTWLKLVRTVGADFEQGGVQVVG